ncbi:hypothetical protein D3C74_351060 [compost metagenome]
MLHEISHFLGSKASFDPPGHKAGIFPEIEVEGNDYIIGCKLFTIRITIFIEIFHQLVGKCVGVCPGN